MIVLLEKNWAHYLFAQLKIIISDYLGVTLKIQRTKYNNYLTDLKSSNRCLEMKHPFILVDQACAYLIKFISGNI